MLESTTTGSARTVVTWRGGSTARFRDAGNPEQRLFGSMYECWGTAGDIVAQNNWLWAGTGLAPGTPLRNGIAGEDDRVWPDYAGPATDGLGVQVLARSPLSLCRNQPATGQVHEIVYYRAPSGAQVFNAGTHGWVCALNASCWYDTGDVALQAAIQQMTLNVLAQIDSPNPAPAVGPPVQSRTSLRPIAPRPSQQQELDHSLLPTFHRLRREIVS